jgi:hypothetical protein
MNSLVFPGDRRPEGGPRSVGPRSGYLDPAAKPVAVIEPGDTVRYPNPWTHWGNEATFGMSFADREPLRHRYPTARTRYSARWR